MKNIICFILLVVSSTLYSQNRSIAVDSAYLHYEAAYLHYQVKTASSMSTLDAATGEFSNKFTNEKTALKFQKSNDKLKWLNKHFKKTNFQSAEEAVSMFKMITELEKEIKSEGTALTELFENLKQKYHHDDIYQTLKTRLLKE